MWVIPSLSPLLVATRGEDVAEPPQLYGLHVPVIVLKTYDCCTREPNNSDSLSGVLGEPRIIHILQLIHDQHGVATKLQYFVQK